MNNEHKLQEENLTGKPAVSGHIEPVVSELYTATKHNGER
jgi:hypothetical protein